MTLLSKAPGVRRGCGLVLALLLAVPGRGQSLEAAAAKWPGLRIGAAVNDGALTGSDNAYASHLQWHFQSPSPENAFKWAGTQPGRYDYAWDNADRIATLACAANRSLRGHTLLWHQSIPAWVTNSGFTPEQNRDVLFHHLDTVAGRYRDVAFCWDVVNEAFLDSGALRTSHWYNAPGIGYATNGTRYLEELFRRARTVLPDTELVYNDYSIETANAKSDAIYAMAQDFLSRSVPLDAIGFQMHITGMNYTNLRANLKRFNDLGLNLHITEMDVSVPVDSNGVATVADLNAQAEVYWNVLGVALGQPRFTVFQTWGFTDKYSWIPAFSPGRGAALLLDENYNRKPAFWAVWNALANQAEKLPVVAWSAGDTTNLFAQDTLSAGQGVQLQADAAGDFVTLAVEVPFAGAWDVKAGYRLSGASGKFQLAVAPEGSTNFVNLGGVVDAYAAAVGAGMSDLGTNDFPGAGRWWFRFNITGRNVAATDYNLTLDYLRLTPVAGASNSAPTISSITDKTTLENIPLGPLPFTIGDAQTAAGALIVQAVSLNTNLVPAAGLVLGGSGANRTLTVTPAAHQSGLAALLLLVSDGTNQTPETFTLTVQPTNTPPQVAATNLTLAPNTAVDVDLAALATDAETAAAAMRFEVSGASNGSAALLGDGRTARFTAATNHVGPAAFTVSATDTGPEARWLVHYDFDLPDDLADFTVTDQSPNRLPGSLQEFGGGTARADTNVPPALAGSGARSLRLTEAGNGNGARLETTVPTASYSLRNADWTFAAWFRRSTATNDDFLLHLGAGDGFGGDGDELDVAVNPAGQLQLRHYNTAGTLDVSLSGGTVTTGVWQHVAVCFDRTNSNAGWLKLFLDGAPVSTNAPVTWALDQTSEIVFGGAKNGTESRWWNGNLDDVALWGGALTPAEISALASGRSVAHLGGLSRSNVVLLTVAPTNAPPVCGPLTNRTLIAGETLGLIIPASDPDPVPQSLNFALLNPPAGASINPTNGQLTWRPALAQAGTSNVLQVVVTEAGWRTNVFAQADAFVRDGTNAALNFGSDTVLTVKRDTVTNFSRESFVRFPVPWFPGVLADAQLRLQTVVANLPGTHALALVTDDAWAETTVAWNTKPAGGAALATWSPVAGQPVLVSAAAALTQDAPWNGALSLRLFATNSTADGKVDYAARETGANGPQLSLFYTNLQPLSVTQAFAVTVVAPVAPVLSGAGYTTGAFRLTLIGDGGPDYTVLTSSNLLDWSPWFTTGSPAGAFSLTVTNFTPAPRQFYRVQLGP